MINLQAAQLAAQVAQNAAQQEFQRMRFETLEQPQFAHLSEMDKEQLAFQKAQQAFQEAFQTASLTGMWNGQQTIAEQQRQIENQMSQAGLTGMYQGQETTAEKQRKIANLMAEAGITGMYNGEETAAERAAKFQRAVSEAGLTGTYEGQQTIDWLAQQAGITGYFQGKDTLQRQQMQNENSLALLNLQSSLRGPRNAFQYANAIASTPQGLQGELQAMLGRAQVPGAAGYSQPYQPASLQGLAGDMLGGYLPSPYGSQNPMQGQVAPSGVPDAMGMMGMAGLPSPALAAPVGAQGMLPAGVPDAAGRPASGTMNTGINGEALGLAVPQVERAATMATTQAASPFQINDGGVQAPGNLYNYQPTGDGRFYSYPPGMLAPPEAMQFSSSVPQNQSELKKFMDSLPLGSQISSSYWNQAPQYTKDLMMSGYEARGDDAGYIEEQYQRSLPKYTGARVGSFI